MIWAFCVTKEKNINEFYMQASLNKGVGNGIVVKMLDRDIVMSEFEFWFRYYIHFWTNALGKTLNPFYLPAMG